jgi:hypothetical protein
VRESHQWCDLDLRPLSRAVMQCARGRFSEFSEAQMNVKIVVHEAEEGGYWAEVPALPGCVSQQPAIMPEKVV